MHSNNLLGLLTAPTRVGSGDLLGVLVLIRNVLAIAWVIVFILWVRALVKYLHAYRDYEQSHGQPYQSPCEANQCSRVILQNLRRLGLLLSNLAKKFHLGLLILRIARIPPIHLFVKIIGRKIAQTRDIHNAKTPNEKS
jgi:hypothetical protein